MEHGASAAIAVVGYAGLVGIALFLRSETMPKPALGRSTGHVYRLSAGLFK
jgi:hypothetical protein